MRGNVTDQLLLGVPNPKYTAVPVCELSLHKSTVYMFHAQRSFPFFCSLGRLPCNRLPLDLHIV